MDMGTSVIFLASMYIQCFELWKYCSYALVPMALGTCRCEDLIDCSMQAGRHTIILMQPSQNRASRTFMDYNSINHALDGICGLYERKIRDINPMVPNITYDISDLYNFIDGLADISALVFDHSIQAFLPYDRQWIKQKLFQHLKKLSQR